jgi:uncharacterized protein YprB with RNaseH-like and TPR domain
MKARRTRIREKHTADSNEDIRHLLFWRFYNGKAFDLPYKTRQKPTKSTKQNAR